MSGHVNLTVADGSSSLRSLTRASKGHGKRKKKDQRKENLQQLQWKERMREILKQEECRDNNEIDSSESVRQRLGRSSPLCFQE